VGLVGMMLGHQQHADAQTPATIAAYWQVDDSNSPLGNGTKVYSGSDNLIKLAYVQRISTGVWIFKLQKPIILSNYLVMISTNGMHGGDVTYAYGVVAPNTPKNGYPFHGYATDTIEIDTYGREHYSANNRAPWQTSNTSFTVMMFNRPTDAGPPCPIWEPDQKPQSNCN
jgi:hypothetical protein